MPDLVIAIGAEDQAGDVLRKVSDAFADMGKKAKEAAEKPVSAVQRLAETVKTNLMGALTGMAQEAGKQIVEFAKRAVTAQMEAEQAVAKHSSALKQLGYESEHVGEALRQQASALQSTLGVNEEMVLSMQSLMIRYGTAPRDVNATTRAILDYAAATGQNAESATQQLLKAIEGGGAGLKKMGIDIDETGDKSKDLALAVEALGAKFGGAAQANAETLAGRLAILKARMGEFEESLGSVFATIEKRFGIVNSLTEALNGLESAFGGGEAGKQKDTAARAERLNAAIELRTQAMARLREAERLEQAMQVVGGKQYDEAFVRMMKLTDAYELQRAAVEKIRAEVTLAGLAANGVTNEGQSGLAQKNNLGGKRQEADAKATADRIAQQVKASEEIGKAGADLALRELKAVEDHGSDLAAAMAASMQTLGNTQADSLKAAIAEGKVRDALEKQVADAKAAGEAQFAAAGTAMGMSFVSNMLGEIQKLGRGEEMDIGAVLKGLLPSLASYIGGLAGGPVGSMLAGSGASMFASLFHDGGWVGDVPRHHSGAWIGADEKPAILQDGERVFSRQEVRNAGGPAAVDRMARGNPSRPSATNVYISAMDSQSMVENFSGRGGRAMNQAVRRGQGELAHLLRKRGR